MAHGGDCGYQTSTALVDTVMEGGRCAALVIVTPARFELYKLYKEPPSPWPAIVTCTAPAMPVIMVNGSAERARALAVQGLRAASTTSSPASRHSFFALCTRR